MKPRDLIRLPKTVTKKGEWKVITGKGRKPGQAFPLTRRVGYELGRNWHWRVDVLDGGGKEFRLLTAFKPDVEEYLAWLSLVRGNDYAIVGQLEFHGDHAGWHFHMACCDIDEVDAGNTRPWSFHRFPPGKERHRRQAFDMTEMSALSKAFRFFRVGKLPKETML